jgi:hypothetical protein
MKPNLYICMAHVHRVVEGGTFASLVTLDSDHRHGYRGVEKLV